MTEPMPESGTDLPVDTETAETSAQAADAAGEAAAGAREAHAEHGARPGTERTVVHLLRHGEVDNPHKILYGRLPDYHLSALGREMAEAVEARGLEDAKAVGGLPADDPRIWPNLVAAQLDWDVEVIYFRLHPHWMTVYAPSQSH